jgi:translation initiation factor 6
MQFIRLSFNTDPNLGLYGFATESYCLLGFESTSLDKIKSVLGVDTKVLTIAESKFVGIFAAGNSNGIVVPKIIEDYELKRLKQALGDINVEVIKAKHTALGNLILCNDKGCLVSPSLVKYKKQISDCLGVEVETGRIARTEIVGSAGRASNNGCLLHRDASQKDLERIENLLKVKADVGTVNFGTPFIKAGIILNSKGIIISDRSTGPEIDRCFEVFK